MPGLSFLWDQPRAVFLRQLATALVLALQACTCFGIEAGPSPSTPFGREVLKTWKTDQGLPQNFVTSINQTPDGFLWVGTNGGLARFDGLRFRSYAHEGPPVLRHGISQLVVDAEGTLWVGGSAGLSSYRQGRFRPVSLGTLGIGAIQGLLRCGQGACVLAWTKDGLYRVDKQSTTAVKVPMALSSVLDIQQDREGKLWVAGGGRVEVIAEGQAERVYPLPDAKLVFIAEDGRVFAGDGHRLFRWEASGFVPQPKEGTEEFVQVLIDRRKRLWMASGGLEGISRFADGRVEMLGASQGLASNDARVLFEDRSGDMWIGTISGLQRLHEGRFLRYTEQDGLPQHSQYDSIFEDQGGTMWTGTLDAGVWRLVKGRWENFGVREGIPRGQIRGLADGATGPVVAIADYGLFALDKGRFHKLPNIPAGYISSPVRLSDGSLWFAVLHRGLFRLQEGVLREYGAAQGLTDDVIWSILPDGKGGLWVGGKTGAYHWDGTRWRHEIVSANTVDSIALLRRGGVLLGTTNGLLYRNGASSWTLTEEDGLPADVMFSLLEDGHGDLWIATARGICRIPRDQMEELNQGKRRRVSPEVYIEDDGLKSPGILPLGQVTSVLARDGRPWFATESGPVVTEPATERAPVPRAVVDGISVDEEILEPGEARVKPGRHRLVFAFTAASFLASEQTHFRYRLLGWKSDWVNADELREASYMGLAPGSYSFEVQAASRTGEWGPVSEAVTVELQPFFWQTRWFFAIVVFLSAALLIEVTRRRTLRRAEKLNFRFQERSAERERIALQIHDTFIQDLTGTALQLELVGLQLEEDPKVAKVSLSSLAARMREMVARSRDIVSNLHSMAGPQFGLTDLLTYVEAEFRLTESPVYEISSSGGPRLLHPFLRDEVYSICREAIANAFRHADARRIDVIVSFEPRKLLVTVSDDGVGMSEPVRLSGRPGHFGLAGMQAHARRVDASLEVDSILGKGTRISLRVPLRWDNGGGARWRFWRD